MFAGSPSRPYTGGGLIESLGRALPNEGPWLLKKEFKSKP
ncbi:hypothetical protein Cadr_000007011 [Camelus dromedarius]|uniref:Uncharacterized protein n=1 Tax=Camelus dromedarius TaxID=9838 RepID=A0A5N4E788_CAMDR|nr:hypothetical protein Cadr_000007011 [Camelus dromedarius]